VKAYHAYTTFAAPTPLQYAVAKGIDNLIGNTDLRQSEAKLYEQNAQRLGTALEEVLGVTIYWPQGGYFLVADVSSTGKLGMAFAEWLVLRYKIACVPMAVFYSPETGKSFEHLVRFAVCKTEATIAKACARLKQGEIE
jgi:aspartate/methionine/tyrosine aminotransferase